MPPLHSSVVLHLLVVVAGHANAIIHLSIFPFEHYIGEMQEYKRDEYRFFGAILFTRNSTEIQYGSCFEEKEDTFLMRRTLSYQISFHASF